MEKKFLDTAWNSVTIGSSADGSGLELQPSTPASILCLNAPAIGDDESSRDGRRIVITDVWVSGSIFHTALTAQTTVPSNGGLWFALVLDTQCNGATIVSENVYEAPGTSAFESLPSPVRNLSNNKRYRILAMDRLEAPELTMAQDSATTFAVGYERPPCVNMTWKGSIVTHFTGTTGVVGSIADNALHVLAFTATTTFTPKFFGKGRIRFIG